MAPPRINNPPTTKAVPSHSEDPQSSLKQADKQPYIKNAPKVNLPEPVDLGTRTSSIQSDVQPQLNTHAKIKKYSDSYLEHNAQVVAIENEIDLANSVSEIKELLANPAKARKTSHFTILWVPDDDGGDTIRVIPPDEKLKQQEKLATELQQKLGEQLTKLESRYVPSKLQKLEDQKNQELILRNHAAEELNKLGASIPNPPAPTRVAVIGASSITTSVTTPATKPNTEMPSVKSETPSTTVQPSTEPPAEIPAKRDGKFAVKFNPPPYDHSLPSEQDFEQDIDYKEVLDSDMEAPNYPPPPPLIDLQTTASIQQPLGILPKFMDVNIVVLGKGKDGVHSDLFMPAEELSFESMGSVNASDNNLYVGGGGINKQFEIEMNKRGDKTDYLSLHESMLSHCESDNFYIAEQHDLKHAPSLEASFIYRPSADREPTGTIIVNVFKPPYPNGNPANKAMIYIVPPDGRRSDMTEKKFKSEITQTAADIVGTMHQYNRYAKDNGLDVIESVRITGFSSDSYRHNDVTEESVGQSIDEGVKLSIKHFKKDPDAPFLIKTIEYANGSGNVFSHLTPSVPDEHFITPHGFPASAPQDPFATTNLPESDVDWADFAAHFPPSDESVKDQKIEPSNTNIRLSKDPNIHLSKTLQRCSQELAKKIENNKESYVSSALNHADQKTTNKSNIGYRRLTKIRKAMMARTLMNFHRGHARDQSGEVANIPEQALPFIEMAVLSSTPHESGGLLGGSSSVPGANAVKRFLKTLPVPDDIAKVLAETVNGVRTDLSKDNVLSMIMRDIERLEGMRGVDQFDIRNLECYNLYGRDGKHEVSLICIDYMKLLQDQYQLDVDMESPKSLQKPIVILKEGSIEIGRYSRKFKPSANKSQEKSPAIYEESFKQLNKQSTLKNRYIIG
ncbi:hypothetical protein ACH42_09155 [Endozoicomonas sp. (ex Bugula neritina AB1)]|nr:hypothetical protein ACH42_09155 [Endozoicomonas sp. (ex Bugula neritina AB1)]